MGNKKKILIGTLCVSLIVLGSLILFFNLKKDCTLPEAFINGNNPSQIIQELNSQGIYIDFEDSNIQESLENDRIDAFVKSYCN